MDQFLSAPPPTANAVPDRRLGIGNRFRLLVALLGLIWLINAAFQFSAWIWLPTQQHRPGLGGLLTKAVNSAPAWLEPLVHAIASGIDGIGPTIIAGAMVAIAVVLGLALLTNTGLRAAAIGGMAYCLFCWVALSALGAPYGHGQTDPGVFPAYIIAFLFVLSVAPVAAPRPGSIAVQPSPPLWTAVRVLFGLLWLFDAALKWSPYFLTHFLGQLTPAVQGQPHWIAAYIGFVITVVQAIGPHIVAIVVAIVETGIAVSLLTGLLLPIVLPLAFLYSLSVWTTAEGFGGPYSLAGTGVRGDVLGNVLIYAVIFLFLMARENRRGRLTATGAVLA